MTRINQYLARRGIASRRGADNLIASGRVNVNGIPAQLGIEVDPQRDRITIDGQELQSDVSLVTLAFNKPINVVTTRGDTHGRNTIFDDAPDIAGLCAIGRLDMDSRGLLLLTTDGELAHRVAHPRFGMTKVYVVEVDKPISELHLERLRSGIKLEDGLARPRSVERISAHTVKVEMSEGKKREVRRMFAALGLEVLSLQRVAVGPIGLGNLPEGEFRRLSNDELQQLYHAVGLTWTKAK